MVEAPSVTVYPDQLRSEYFEPRGLVGARESPEAKPFRIRPCDPGTERSLSRISSISSPQNGMGSGNALIGHGPLQRDRSIQERVNAVGSPILVTFGQTNNYHN